MDTELILLAIAMLMLINLMTVVTFRKKINHLQEGIDKQKIYWKSVEYSIEIQSNQLSKEIQERGKVLDYAEK